MSLLVREMEVEFYRSLRRIRFPAERLTVFQGANGVGKTNLYRALQLIQAAAARTLARELAAERGHAIGPLGRCAAGADSSGGDTCAG
jgi:predicted ATPase